MGTTTGTKTATDQAALAVTTGLAVTGPAVTGLAATVLVDLAVEGIIEMYTHYTVKGIKPHIKKYLCSSSL